MQWLMFIRLAVAGRSGLGGMASYRFHSGLNREVCGIWCRWRAKFCDSIWPSASEGTDGQMHETPNSAVEDSVALENARGSAAAHSDDMAARERNDPARDRGGDGCFVEHREPRPHGL